MERFTWTAKDGKKISVVEWAAEQPVGVVQISHGMAEHILRYEKLATYLNGLGFTVFGDDHRCFGQTDVEQNGYTEGDNWEGTLSDLGELTEYYKEKYALPVLLFGHSYGSFLAQAYLQRYSDQIIGAILCGSDKLPVASTTFGFVLSSVIGAFKGDKAKAHFVANMTFGAYEKKLGGSMISSIEAENERYRQDSLCGEVCSYGFYRHFFNGARKLYGKKGLRSVRKDLPVLLIAGENDPVGRFGKGMTQLYGMYHDLGLDVELILYEGARHEILNDVCEEQVKQDISDFVKKVFAEV
ncbi:MAG: alpha/beta hydrolase [Clostridia bacterium]|nr:alpha/beta hydrolase [Clostridia bacterium]